MEVTEAAHAVERVTNDQQRPALADHLERAGDRAVLAFVVLTEHGRDDRRLSSIIEPDVLRCLKFSH